MTKTTPMRDFGLEVFFSEWEFAARHHMTASDIESMSQATLLSYANDEDRDAYDRLWLGYTQTYGLPALRTTIAETYDHISAAQILCLAGAGEGLYIVARVLLSADDHVIVPTPNYQSAETVPLSVCSVTGVPLVNEQGGQWTLDLEALRDAIQPNTKLLSLNFPHNPTGMLIDRPSLSALIDLCRERGIWILSDEVYRGVELNPADRMPQIADVYERGISLNVMSKAYGLPGLRIGWLAMQDKEMLERFERYKHYLSICNSGPSEILAMIALKARDQILAQNHALLQRNVVALEAVLAEYPSLFDWSRPMGGCVAFPHYRGPDGVEAFCQKLLKESGVLLLPGSIYASELTATPANCFRIGFGRAQVFTDGLAAMADHLDRFYADHRA